MGPDFFPAKLAICLVHLVCCYGRPNYMYTASLVVSLSPGVGKGCKEFTVLFIGYDAFVNNSHPMC